ncbi:uncharacterized protein LOC119513920 isoform X3 [Choloepus didactylus]|uniref:uncharacterized protein LOC119513920 isoform X3 n=1 Tax=Choloepus didactylus TaxID=27675 RepID=UPI00189E9D28|nr:uncharacterized protein LOC119513920 isoform X3 [Choloepus didactylus]
MILVVKSTRSPEKKKQMEVTETTAVEILAVRLKWKSRGKPWRKLGGSFSLSPGSRRPRSEVRPARVLPDPEKRELEPCPQPDQWSAQEELSQDCLQEDARDITIWSDN